METWINLIIAIISGIATCVPLVIKLVNTLKESAKEKNWTPLMQLILKLISEAEQNHSEGAAKKQYVLDSIIAVKDTLNYPVDMNVVSEMIDSIVDITKKVNTNK